MSTDTKTLTTHHSQPNIPALRFPEFQGEWESKPINKTSDLIGGYAFSSNRMKSSISTYQVVKMSNLYGGALDLSRNSSFIEDIEESERKYSLKSYDILISLTGTFGKRDFGFSVLLKEPNNLLVNQRVGLIRVLEEFNSAYIANLIRCETFQKRFHALAIGGTGNQANVSLVDAGKITSNFPSYAEQQKIATFLTTVDQKIEKLQRKKDQLTDYKKGMMQRLFAAGEKSVECGMLSGECQQDESTQNSPLKTHHSLHSFRFKDDNGKDFPEWEEKKLGEIAKFQKGKGISKVDIVQDGNTPCIRYGELYTKYSEVISIISSSTNTSPSVLIISKGNEVIIPASGETALDIATASCVLNSGVALGGDLNIISTEENGVFLAYYLNSAKKIDIARLSQGISVIHLYSSQLASLKILVPSKPEQREIADCLTALDQKIELVDKKLNQAQSFKKGLLQQMFV